MKKIELFTKVFLLFAVLCSFGGGLVKPYEDTSFVPADFDGRKGILLVETAPFIPAPKANAKAVAEMKEILDANYPYKYEFATAQEIGNSEKFADKEKYRWALVSSRLTKGGGSSFNGNMATVNSVDFHIYDCKADKDYPATGRSTSFFKATFAPVVATLREVTKSKSGK